MNTRRNFLKFIFYSSFFLYTNKISKALKNPTNTVILTSPIFKKYIISENHPERPERIEFIKEAVKDSELTNILENYYTERNVENWIKLIHTETHINSLQKSFPLVKKSHNKQLQYVLMVLIDYEKKIKMYFATRPPGHHALNTGKHEGFCFYNNI